MKLRKKKIFKIGGIIVGSLVGLILLLLAVVSIVCTPERLTKWVNRYGTEYLVDGEVSTTRVDLSVWSTFPHAELTVDSLRIVNRNPALPDDYRIVSSIDRFCGRVNLAALLIGRISIHGVDIDRPQAIVFVNDTISSLSILPPSEDDDNSDDEPLSLPDIRIVRFVINGGGAVRYVNCTDSTDIALTLARTELAGTDDTPQYAVNFSGRVKALPFLADSLLIGLDGGIGWNPDKPLALSLHSLHADIDSIRTVTSLKADLTNDIRLDELDFELKPVKLQRLSQLAAQLPQMQDMIPEIEGDATVSFRAQLNKPYTYLPDTLLLPDLHTELKIEDSQIDIPSYYLTLDNLALDVAADISDAGLDASTVDVKRLQVKFPATDFTVTARATNLASNPRAAGNFKGAINFTNLNPRMWTLLGMRLRGEFDADINFDLSQADLTPNTFHHAKLSGDAVLTDFGALLPSDTIAGGMTRAQLRFGSATQIGNADSLFTAGVLVDSAWVFMPEMTVRLAGLDVGFGVLNDSQTADTTVITPMGGGISLRSLRYVATTDSSRAVLRNLSGRIGLTRYEGNAHAPALDASVKAKRLMYVAGANRMSLSEPTIAFGAYAKPRGDKSRQPRVRSREDSLRMVAHRDSMLLAQSGNENIDFGVDRSTISLLRRWNVTGSIKAKSGRLKTPAFPLRTRMTGLNVSFNSDSLMLNSLRVTAGRSDFSLTGRISNLQRALGRSPQPQPLQIRLDLSSDTINVNQLTQAVFRGAALQAQTDSTAVAVEEEITDDEYSDEETDEIRAFVVPMNIDAELNFAAANIIYSDIALTDFRGSVLVANGAAHLRDLYASTDIGSAGLNMLYYAPTVNDVNFGMTLDLNNFQIGRVTELLPTLDTIMPMLNSLGGVVSASVSATTPVDSLMNIKFPELKAMVRITGDSLKLLDEETFKTISKWLLFRNKEKNMIDHMDVRVAVEDNRLTLYPFMFDFDRYCLGVMGGNDVNLNLNYHVSILKSPIPFKFGINVKGTADKMKIRLGRARFKENMAVESVELSDTIRVNLAREIRDVFRRGAKNARLAPLDIRRPEELQDLSESEDTVSAEEQRYFIEQGLIEAPADTVPQPEITE